MMKLTDEEREKRVILVAEYVIETGSSTRVTAKFFSDNFFLISNATVSDYCERYIIKYPKKLAALNDVISNNKGKNLEDSDIQKRIYENAKDIINGLTIEEISTKSGVSYWTVYRDLTERLIKINPQLAGEIKAVFSKRSKENLGR